jgi:SPP1 family predicted phage head-tail adaptor
MIKAGELRHGIKIRLCVETISATGERVKDFNTKVMTVRAGVRYLSSNERLVAGKEIVDRIMIFKIRYMKDVASDSIIEYLNKRYEIIQIENVKNKNQELILTGALSE